MHSTLYHRHLLMVCPHPLLPQYLLLTWHCQYLLCTCIMKKLARMWWSPHIFSFVRHRPVCHHDNWLMGCLRNTGTKIMEKKKNMEKGRSHPPLFSLASLWMVTQVGIPQARPGIWQCTLNLWTGKTYGLTVWLLVWYNKMCECVCLSVLFPNLLVSFWMIKDMFH